MATDAQVRGGEVPMTRQSFRRAAMATMQIVYLVEDAVPPWGGVQVVFRQADALRERGHDVTILCRSEAPTWHEPRCKFERVDAFHERYAPQTIVVGTWCPTVPAALVDVDAIPVHFCQGYEGDDPKHEASLATIERIYRLPTKKLVISPFLERRIARLFGAKDLHRVPYGIRDEIFAPASGPRCGSKLRIGLVGPYTVPWKDIPTGLEALEVVTRRLAGRRAIEVVRISPVPFTDEERLAWRSLDVEAHCAVSQDEMARLYRSLDMFLGTSNGGAEGFFLPAIEAMASGLPCVLTDIDCFRDYGSAADRQGCTYARFTAAGDAEAMASAILEVALDEAERGRLARRGLEVAREHRFAVHVDAVEAVFTAYVDEARSESKAAREARRLERELASIAWRGIDALILRAREGSTRDVIEAAEALCTLTPEHADAYLMLVRLLTILPAAREPGAAAAAGRALKRALELCPLTPGLARLAAQVAVAERDPESAAQWYERAQDLGHPGRLFQSERARFAPCVC